MVGVGRSASNLSSARQLGIADRTWTQDQCWTDELIDADLVLLATPVGQIPALLALIAPALGAATVVTDAGSTKQDVIAAGRRHLGAALPRFVPGHPIAGTERSGAAAASDALFRGRSVILTPLAETSADAQKRVADAWTACGGVVGTLEATRHDEIFAAVSHLPHALAFALVALLAARADALDYFRYAATGFRDFTRLASSDPEMWRDVCLGNATALRREFITAVLIGLACGTIVGAIVFLWRHDPRGAFAIGGSIALSLISACLFGDGAGAADQSGRRRR